MRNCINGRISATDIHYHERSLQETNPDEHNNGWGRKFNIYSIAFGDSVAFVRLDKTCLLEMTCLLFLSLPISVSPGGRALAQNTC